jgi:dolichol-phosphate mannosyltransferase
LVINVQQAPILEKNKCFKESKPVIAIMIPTYCEEENIEDLIREIQNLNLNATILIIDDSSPDKTQEIVKDLNNEYDNILLISRPKKLGLGAAITTGFRKIISLDPLPDYVITMDSDFSHNPKYIPRLLDSAESENDIVIGSRYIDGGEIRNWPIKRRILSRLANIIASVIIGNNVQDYTSGFRSYSNNYINQTIRRLHSSKFEIQIETIEQAKLNGFKIKEIPVTFENRKNGKSKLSSGEFAAFIIYITKSLITNLTNLK